MLRQGQGRNQNKLAVRRIYPIANSNMGPQFYNFLFGTQVGDSQGSVSLPSAGIMDLQAAPAPSAEPSNAPPMVSPEIPDNVPTQLSLSKKRKSCATSEIREDVLAQDSPPKKRKPCAKKHVGLNDEEIEEKRLRNNELERKRQQGLSDGFKSLSEVLPDNIGASNHKPTSKISILENAIYYIATMTSLISQHDGQMSSSGDVGQFNFANPAAMTSNMNRSGNNVYGNTNINCFPGQLSSTDSRFLREVNSQSSSPLRFNTSAPNVPHGFGGSQTGEPSSNQFCPNKENYSAGKYFSPHQWNVSPVDCMNHIPANNFPGVQQNPHLNQVTNMKQIPANNFLGVSHNQQVKQVTNVQQMPTNNFHGVSQNPYLNQIPNMRQMPTNFYDVSQNPHMSQIPHMRQMPTNNFHGVAQSQRLNRVTRMQQMPTKNFHGVPHNSQLNRPPAPVQLHLPNQIEEKPHQQASTCDFFTSGFDQIEARTSTSNDVIIEHSTPLPGCPPPKNPIQLKETPVLRSDDSSINSESLSTPDVFKLFLEASEAFGTTSNAPTTTGNCSTGDRSASSGYGSASASGLSNFNSDPFSFSPERLGFSLTELAERTPLNRAPVQRRKINFDINS